MMKARSWHEETAETSIRHSHWAKQLVKSVFFIGEQGSCFKDENKTEVPEILIHPYTCGIVPGALLRFQL